MIAAELVLLDPGRFSTLIMSSTYAQFQRQVSSRFEHLSSWSNLRGYAGYLLPQLVPCAFEAKMKMNMKQMHGSRVHNDKARYQEVINAKLKQKLR